MGDVGGNSAQAEIEEVRVSAISAPIELNHTISYLRLGTPPIYHTSIPEGIPLDHTSHFDIPAHSS